ncbi:MAG: hypothetical protein SGJ11_02495 [Phycisphaerae bacterium]|nr:hypothetical protein [Phycisphaerae bacterium]
MFDPLLPSNNHHLVSGARDADFHAGCAEFVDGLIVGQILAA